MLLPIKLKDAATEAFQDNRKLTAMSEEERELTFRAQNGVEFDALMYEDELTEPAPERELSASRSKHFWASA